MSTYINKVNISPEAILRFDQKLEHFGETINKSKGMMFVMSLMTSEDKQLLTKYLELFRPEIKWDGVSDIWVEPEGQWIDPGFFADFDWEVPF